MLYNNYTEELLAIKDVIVTNIKNFDREIYIDIEFTRKEHICPSCKHVTKYIHDYRIQVIKEISILAKHTYYRLRKRRYVCKHCNKRFYEHTPFLPRYHRMTSRLVQFIITEMQSTLL